MLVLVLLCSLAAAAPVIEGITDAEDTPGVRAIFDVDASAATVVDLLWDVARFKTVFPDIQELTVLARPDDHTIDVRFVVDAFVARPTYTLRRTLNASYGLISWVNIAGDLKKIVGHWQVVATDVNHCRVRYQTVVDVGIPGASAVYASMVMGKVEQVIERVRRAAVVAPAALPATSPPALTSGSP